MSETANWKQDFRKKIPLQHKIPIIIIIIIIIDIIILLYLNQFKFLLTAVQSRYHFLAYSSFETGVV